MMHVAFLAAQAVPNDCGIWMAVRCMIEALIQHGGLTYTFETNASQAELVERFAQNDRWRFVSDLSGNIPRAMWLDGEHPRFRRLDAARDWAYQKLLRDGSVSKFFFARQIRHLRADLCHCPYEALPFGAYQRGFTHTQVVHDFQAAHLPELQTRERLDRLEPEFCSYRRASAVCVLGETCKQDAIRFAKLEPNRVFVTPYGPWETPSPASPESLEVLRRKFRLPEAFLFYPAPTKVHKNHARLIRALATLKKKGLRIPLVTTGKQRPYYDELLAIIRDSGMQPDVLFTDFVDLETLYGLYDMSTAVVLPTLFEGATGIPLLEALSKGKPIAAARICEIPIALGESGLLFDPYSEAEIAATIQRLWESPSLRAELSSKARQTNLGRSWASFAKATEAAFQYAHDHPSV
jgi:glycosyltransferase involved in cell wall biosynthesis